MGAMRNPLPTIASNATQGAGTGNGRVLSGSAYNHPASALLTSYHSGNGGQSVAARTRCPVREDP